MSQKNILLDLFLFSRCLFFVGDTSGNYSLAQAFRKPICFFNFAPFGHFHSWSENSISIFKNVKNERTGKLENFSNLLKYEHGYEIHNDKTDSARRYVNNTKKEISETVKEMEARISGSLYDSNEHLQRRFQKLFIPSYLHQSVNSKCGNYFLEKYEHLLK
jgi:putative glycosyltransferase (TIGR04372 family)